MIEAFQDTKAALAGAALLMYPRHNAPTSLTVDTSEQVVGVILQQLVHRICQPLTFFSKQLCPLKKKKYIQCI